MKHLHFPIAAAFLLALLQPASAQTEGEVKLREALRNTTIQLRKAQGDADEARIAKDQIVIEKDQLAKKVEELVKQAVKDQEAANSLRDELRASIARQDAEILRLNSSLEKWKTAQIEASGLAATKEAERAKWSERAILYERRSEDLLRRNHELHKLGTEVVHRLERYGLGTALAAREPFIGTTKVKLQNLVQDYQDSLDDQMRDVAPAPGQSAPAAKPAPAAESKPTSTPAKSKPAPPARGQHTDA